ncbi:hypothetical protein LINGRAHAP2_LOCUS14845 [Linum grandiflorum]
MTAERILPISAAGLARAYPDDYDPLPHMLQLLIGQHGLLIPRAQVLASLPPPPLPQSPRSNLFLPSCTPFILIDRNSWTVLFHGCCSPLAHHDMPIPPDPAYVPLVPTALPSYADVAPSFSIPLPNDCSTRDKSHHVMPLDEHDLPPVPKFVHANLSYLFTMSFLLTNLCFPWLFVGLLPTKFGKLLLRPLQSNMLSALSLPH